jgi:hypothetical protein
VILSGLAPFLHQQRESIRACLLSQHYTCLPALQDPTLSVLGHSFKERTAEIKEKESLANPSSHPMLYYTRTITS